MLCIVYRSRRRRDTYLYVADPAALDNLPVELRTGLGELEEALRFDLHPERKLARTEASTVLANIAAIGYHLQFPPPSQLPVD